MKDTIHDSSMSFINRFHYSSTAAHHIVMALAHYVFLLCSDVCIFRELFHNLHYLTLDLLRRREEGRG